MGHDTYCQPATHHSQGTNGPVHTANRNHPFWENNMPATHKENYNFLRLVGNNVIHMIEENNDTYNYYPGYHHTTSDCTYLQINMIARSCGDVCIIDDVS